MPLDALGPSLDVAHLRVLELPAPMVAAGAIGARVTGVDGFGNVQLNVGLEDLEAAGVAVAHDPVGRTVGVGTFADVRASCRNARRAIIDSQGSSPWSSIRGARPRCSASP